MAMPAAETFVNHCNCGGYAWEMNGRPESQPHMGWCPQRDEYAAWYAKQKVAAAGSLESPSGVSHHEDRSSHSH